MSHHPSTWQHLADALSEARASGEQRENDLGLVPRCSPTKKERKLEACAIRCNQHESTSENHVFLW